MIRRSLLAVALLFCLTASAQTAPIRVAIVGLVHGHVGGFLHDLPSHSNITLVGISEPDAALRQRYIQHTHLPASLFFSSEAAMLRATHPQAILIYTSTAGHLAAIQQAAPLHIAAMVEKPLATTYADALAIQQLSERYHVPVLTNYETTWYASNTAAYKTLASGQIGELRKLVIRDGHKGPKEIGVGPEFLNWLTDPQQNGAGALFDFGCYGVDLATWFMHGRLPLSVTAITLHIKPDIYPRVDDDSTILLTYPHAQVIVQGSWNWPFNIKDMQVYGAKGYVDTVYLDKDHGNTIRLRLPHDATDHTETAPQLAAPYDNSLDYFAAVLSGKVQSQNDLTSLDTNVTVVRILDTARQSAQTGRAIRLAREARVH